MALDALTVKISADIKDLVSKLDQGGISLQQFGKQANAVSSKIGKDLKNGSDVAGQSLINLGRIAQDAPFGFIGIQNNISPLLESFQRLQKETGSTSNALKALATGALGVGGLGLAVSVATSLLTVLSQNGFFKTTEKVDEAKKKIEEFNKEVKGIYEGAAKEASQTAGLVAVLESETATRQKKLAAVKELQRISPEIFAGLKLEGDAVSGLDQAYQAYLQNLRTVIAAKVIQKKLEDSITKSLEFQGATSTRSIREAVSTLKSLSSVKPIADAIPLKNVGQKQYAQQLTEENKRLAEQADLQAQLTELEAGIKVAGDKPGKEKKVKDVKDYTDVVRRLNEELEINNKLAAIGFITSAEQDIAKIEKVKAAIEQILRLKNGPGVDSPIIASLIGSIAPEELRQQTEKIKQGAQNLMATNPLKLEVPILPKPVLDKSYTGKSDNVKEFSDATRQSMIAKLAKFGASSGINNIGVKVSLDLLNDEELDKKLSNSQKKYKSYLEGIEGSVRGTATNIASTIGETLGNAFSGDNVNLFGSLFQVIGQGLKQLGEAEIAYATSLIVLKSALSNPFAALAAGVAAIAAGQILQNSLPKFADGVQGFRGGTALVGERGPELVQLPTGSNVIANHNLNSITGGQQVYIPDMRLKGTDIYVSFKRTETQIGRRG